MKGRQVKQVEPCTVLHYFADPRSIRNFELLDIFGELSVAVIADLFLENIRTECDAAVG